MNWKYAFATLIVLIGHDLAYSQQIPSTTTAAELWNPWTWFWPYAIATAEGFRDYYQKAQKATNELHQQAYKTNAFPWITGNWGDSPSEGSQEGNSNQQGGQENQGETVGQGNQGDNSGQQGGQENQGETVGQGNQGGNSGQQGGQENQGGTGGQANPEGNGNNQTEKPVEENQTENSETGAQVQGSVNGNGTGNAQISGNV